MHTNLSITESQITDLGSYITGVAWGDITGTLSAQTDLQSALDSKHSLYSAITAPYFTATSSTGTSTFAGDVTLGTNKKLSLYTDLTTGTYNSLLDLNFTSNEAKANIAYRASSGKPVIWLAAPDYLSYPSNQHQHFSIETKRRLDDTLQSRFEVGWGCEDDECIVGTASGADFRLGSGSDLFQVDGDIQHGAAFDFFPNIDSGNTTIGLRVSTTSDTTLMLSALGTTELQIPENLTVVGTALVQGTSLVVDSEGTATFANDRAGTSNFGSFIWRTAGTDQWSFQLRNDSTNNIYLRDNINGRNFLQANQGGALIFDPTTNVGIGSSTPSNKLDVDGAVNATLGYKVGNDFSLYASTTNGSVSVGSAAPWIRSTSTSFKITAIGYQALNTTPTNANAQNNVAIGYQALLNNTTANDNVAVGYAALRANTTGNTNIAFGTQALSTNQTGAGNAAFGTYSLLTSTASFNTGFGNNSFRSNTTGQGNVGIGFNPGYGLGTTPNERSVIDNYMVLIGYQATRDSAVASTTIINNGTAIGKNAKVGCSNCLVLGGTGADSVNVGINDTTPEAMLQINTNSASEEALILKGSAAQSADLMQWQNSAGDVLGVIDESGNVGIGYASGEGRG